MTRCGRLALFFSLIFVASAALRAPGAAQNLSEMDDLIATMDRLSLKLPTNVFTRDPIKRHLGELARERCDQKAIADLGKALENAGYRRDAVTALMRYSETCGGHAPSLRSAVNVLLTLSDYGTAVVVSSKLIELEPFNDNGYFLRAVAYDKGGAQQRAIDDYTTAIELFGDKLRISSVSYLAMARAYEKLGQFCDAITPIETWVALNPASNDTSQTRSIIATYRSKGKCAAPVAPNEEVFPVSRPNNVVKLPVTINGTRGFFVLDTGAAFVSMKSSFAQKAKVQVEPESTVRLHTANGITTGKRGRAGVIQLRTLQAKDVPVVVQDDAKGTYGDGVDGLLGMSFLSRFKLTVDARNVRISGRK